jgi:pyrimidine-nucleoside phosphorylase
VNFLACIEAKRNGQKLDAATLKEIIAAWTAARIPDYQMAAFLMAVFFRGLDEAETAALTLSMRDSGAVLAFPDDPRPLVDKHSTGGVGDKVSLPLAPLLACLDLRVPMISGRGLGITGGTLDKLESIPGFQTALPAERIVEIVQRVGCVICGQTETMVPADKTLYALRDVTGTVASIPLIVSSILSKKLAEGLGALVLDVKYGAAAFMPTLGKARELAQAMVALGNRCGVKTRALLTNMDTPLGRAAGNWLEVKETMLFLEGCGPEDLGELVEACAAHLLVQSGRAATLAAALRQAQACLASGKPRHKWNEMVEAQGGNLAALQRRLAEDYTAPAVDELKAAKSGFVTRCDARVLGEVIRDLGGGRLTKESAINYEVGLDKLAKPGDAIGKDSLLARVHAQNREDCRRAMARLESAFIIGSQPVPQQALIEEVIEH